MTILAAILLLIIIMDPIGNVPVFLSILKNIPIERRRKIIIRELLIALVVLLFFMFIELRFVGLSPTQMPRGHSDLSNKVSIIIISNFCFV